MKMPFPVVLSDMGIFHQLTVSFRLMLRFRVADHPHGVVRGAQVV